MNPVEQYPCGPFTVSIYVDPDPEFPRESFSHLGTMLYTSNRKGYILGDRLVYPHEITSHLDDPQCISLPVYIYDHSGIALSTGGFPDRWDSWMCGCIFVHREDVLREYGRKRLSKKLVKTVRRVLRAEVEELSMYFGGEVYGFEISRDGEVVDSCWGCYGLKYCKSIADESAAALS